MNKIWELVDLHLKHYGKEKKVEFEGEMIEVGYIPYIVFFLLKEMRRDGQTG